MCVGEPTTPAAWNALVREATITGRGIVLEVGDKLTPDARRTIQRASHLVWVISARRAPAIDDLPDRQWIEIEAPGGVATVEEWAALLGDVEPAHGLTLEQLHHVARATDALGGDVDAGVRRLAAGMLEQVTRRIRPTRTLGRHRPQP